MAGISTPLNSSACEEEDKRGICKVYWVLSLSVCNIRKTAFKVTASVYDPNIAEPFSAPCLLNGLHFHEPLVL